MRGQFAGWAEQAFEVLLRLDGTPSQETRENERRDRELLVRQPMIELLNAVADENPAYADFSVWGFAKEVWWWQHQGAVIRVADNLEIALRFDLDGLYVKGSWHHPGADQLRLFRAAVAAEKGGPELEFILGTLTDRGYQITGDVMLRMPRGYPGDHERSELLRYRSMGAGRTLGHDDTLRTPDAVGLLLAAGAELAPLLSWLIDHAIEPDPH